MLEKIYTFDEGRAVVGCSPATFYKALRKKEIRAAKIGRAWRIPESSVSEWLRGSGGSGGEQGEPGSQKSAA